RRAQSGRRMAGTLVHAVHPPCGDTRPARARLPPRTAAAGWRLPLMRICFIKRIVHVPDWPLVSTDIRIEPPWRSIRRDLLLKQLAYYVCAPYVTEVYIGPNPARVDSEKFLNVIRP